ncbi:response regulator transcription factor [Roseomonas chloroacetimidivorans]|uniref:response regulator transcription factor n=1 Tax=Roseomonas chloroacetimidivorans TaxID=1766656 RepID=UPI003C787AA9
MATGPEAAQAVHVIDDDEAVCWAVATLLTSFGLAVETHASGVAFLAALPGLAREPGCVLTDVRMPEMDGLELLRRLRAQGFQRPIVVMTAHGDVSMAVRAMKDGAYDFIEKPFEDEALFTIAQAALAAPDAEKAASTTAGEGRARPEISRAAALIATLSPREREVLDLAMEGKASKVIAYELGISPRTVEVHRLRLLARLGVGSLAEAVRLCVLADMAAPRGAPSATP